jgi:diketogulonate reductase-like aldo/keto reductase
VSEAIRRSGLDRSEIFVETKVWITDYGYDETLHAFDKSAGKLGMEQTDLLILHQPLPGESSTSPSTPRAASSFLRPLRRDFPVPSPKCESTVRYLVVARLVPELYGGRKWSWASWAKVIPFSLR